MSDDLKLELQEERYIELLGKLIKDCEKTQNNPPDFIPQEQLIVDHVLNFLGPELKENGGRLEAKQYMYVDGRPNLIVTYPGTGDGTVSFVGMHMDVVTADAATWDFPPFEMTIEGDELRGRGTTDCCGHVALVADLLKQLSERKVELKRSVVAVFIANEEKSDVLGVGIDELAKRGELKGLSNGPVYWVDSADKQPCLGTAGVIPWKLTAQGKMGHSGLPHNAINPILLAQEALNEVMRRFHEDFKATDKEREYKYAVPSTMKPTQVFYPLGSQNQIPNEATIAGDVRLIPFYDTSDAMAKIQSYVDDVNANIEKLPTHGPVNRYVLPDGTRGKVSIEFGNAMSGVATNINGNAVKALSQATEEVVGELKTYSISGSLPLIRDLVEQGMDVSIVGYGPSSRYHADNELCTLSGMKEGLKVFARIIEIMEDQ